jgi:tRNA dimethylallyltransferase
MPGKLTYPFIICLMGPTAAGKTATAMYLAQFLPCDIISVDSAMIYRYMDIGTAKPSQEELAHVPHKLIDICDPSERYSAAQFCHDAQLAIENSIACGRVPLLVGGTMLYFHALHRGLSPLPSADAQIRADIDAKAQQVGWDGIHQQLIALDPQLAQRIHPNDPQRIQRALEIIKLTGKTVSQLQQIKQRSLSYPSLNILLIPVERAILHQLIATRFSTMLEKGFLNEVENLRQRGDLHLDLPAIRSVGYRQAWLYLSGKISKQHMCEQTVAATRQLAKRQLTWLKSWQDGVCFNSLQPKIGEQILDYILSTAQFKA